MKNLEKSWYKSGSVNLLLWPVSVVFRLLSSMRRTFYRLGIFHRHALSVPVIIVGNISVGGTGKTPLVIWLVNHLRNRGVHAGVISRGYGGSAQHWPQYVRGDSDTAVVGDEPVLIAKRAQCPVAVAPKRILAAKALLKHAKCDVIISDDGLQHYALMRDMEFVVVDGVRRFGNGYCLPAGPLREPRSRLKTVDFVVCNGLPARDEYAMSLTPSGLVNLRDEERVEELSFFRGKQIHAVAGIGNPSRFFSMLQRLGFDVIEHPFPDHHAFQVEDIRFDDGKPVVMTEKDAVKCRRFASDNYWYIAVEAELSADFVSEFDAQFDKLLATRKR